jgi:hypothetical protein
MRGELADPDEDHKSVIEIPTSEIKKLLLQPSKNNNNERYTWTNIPVYRKKLPALQCGRIDGRSKRLRNSPA